MIAGALAGGSHPPKFRPRADRDDAPIDEVVARRRVADDAIDEQAARFGVDRRHVGELRFEIVNRRCATGVEPTVGFAGAADRLERLVIRFPVPRDDVEQVLVPDEVEPDVDHSAPRRCNDDARLRRVNPELVAIVAIDVPRFDRE